MRTNEEAGLTDRVQVSFKDTTDLQYKWMYMYKPFIKRDHFTAGCERENKGSGLILHLSELCRYGCWPPSNPFSSSLYPPNSISFPSFEQNGEGTGVISQSSRGGMALVRLLSLTQKHMVCHRATEVRPPGGDWDHFCLHVCVETELHALMLGGVNDKATHFFLVLTN